MSSGRATEGEQAAALQLLYRHLPLQERAIRVAECLDATARGEFSLDELWVSRTPEGTVQAALLQAFQPGKTAFLWPPMTLAGRDEIAWPLLKLAAESADAAGIEFSQLLLPLEKTPSPLKQALPGHGYRPLTELLRLECSLAYNNSTREPPPETGGSSFDLGDLTLEPFQEADSDRLADLLFRTFQGTLDCPQVTQFRTGEQALERHRGTAANLDREWLFAKDRQGDVGALLVLKSVKERSWEIDYFGVIPEARGRGIGKRLIRWGISHARQQSAERFLAVVDSKNHYACAIYNELGFREQERWEAWVRVHPGRATF